MAKTSVQIAEVIQERLPAPVQLVIAAVLLSVSGFGPIDPGLPIYLSGAAIVAGIGLLGTACMPLAMSPFSADEWEELSAVGQTIVLAVVTLVIFVVIFGLISVP